MAEHLQSNVSQDLVWEICRTFRCAINLTQVLMKTMLGTNNAFLVKRKSGGGSQFSRDPLNLMNKHSRKVDYSSRVRLWMTKDTFSMPASSTTRYATTRALAPDNGCWDPCEERKLTALLGVGCRHSPSRERRRDLDDEENEASQSTGRQQERGFVERAKIWAKVSHDPRIPEFMVQRC